MKKKIKEIKRTNITKNKSNPKISIIIPIYNAEEYLKECLDSIINQTLKEIEIICINDGSTDNSLNIIEGYGKKDTRIKIIDQNNHGVGYSRNVGIRVARGEFLSFIDPDDYYPDKEILSKLYDTAIQQKVNICGGGLIYYNNQNHISTESQKSEEHFSRNGILEYKDYQFDYGFQRYIYKTSLIKNNNIYFPEYKRYQDPPFFCQAMNTAKKFYGITQYSYVYRCNQQKLKWTEEKVFDLLQGLRDNLVYAQKKQLQKLYELTLNRIKKDFKLPILEITSNRIQDIRQEIMQICINNAKRKYKPSEAKVSVILPIYNAEKYLRECLDSVINQSLKEIEIICVNDGSTDNSLDIIKEYAAKDSRIFYIDKPNAGYGQTMNCGIEIATGEYIGIVEPDDFIDLKMYETLYNKAQETGVDFVKGDTYFWWSKNNQKKYSNCITDKSLYNSVRHDLYNIGLIVGAITNCAGIYKRSFINKYAIKYQETPGASFQDQGFYYQVIFNAQSGYYINIPFYYYRQDNSSSSVNSKKTVECIFNEYHFIKSKLSQIKDKEKFYPLYYTKMINSYLWNLSRVEEDAWTEINQKISEEIKQEYASGNLNSSIIDSKTWNKIKPYITGTQTIPVILSADNNYAPYMYITMFSMLENAKKTTSYDYYLLVPSSFDNKNKKMIMKLKENYDCDIHFVDMKNSFSDLKQMISHITSPTYYRLLAADILPKYYEKCLYLDVDVCVCQDLSELYSTDLGNNYVAGVKAAGYHFVPQKHCQRLNLPNIDHYINAGVLVMNLKQIRQDKMTEKFVKLSKNNYETVDQDVLNVACFGRIKTLPLKYNFMQQYETKNLWQSCISKKIYSPEEIEKAKNSPVIIHYADKIKPWQYNITYYDNIWWTYAKKTTYYKKIKKNCKKNDLHKTVLTQLKQYRLDIKNEGGADNKIEISSNKSCRISQPAWFSNAKGIGQVVEGYDKNNLLRIKAIKSGKLILSFKAPDKKIDNKRIPFWIDYKSIKINDQEILNAPISVWHDKPYNYEMNVKNGDVIYITFETQYHQYPKWELQNIIFALNWNNMNVLKKLRKIRKGIAKKIKPKKASKIFCIEQKGCKKTIKLFGFKISFVNKHQELIEQLKQYNRALGKQLERLQNLQESISVQLRNQGNRSNKISEQISKIEKQTDMIKEQLKTISKNTWK